MSSPGNESRSSHDPLYQEIFTPLDLTRKLDLPSDDPGVFEEEQPFSMVWLWVFLGIETIAIFLPLLITGQPWFMFIGMGLIMVLTLSLLGSLKLRTRFDADGIHYRMIPLHRKDQTIPWSEIDSVHVRKYSPIREYGGWGMRYSRNGRAYNVKGDQGIQVVKKNGKRILIGTQQPEDAKQWLDQFPLTV